MLVDDHEVVRRGLAALIEAEEDLEVVGEAGDGPEGAGAVAEGEGRGQGPQALPAVGAGGADPRHGGGRAYQPGDRAGHPPVGQDGEELRVEHPPEAGGPAPLRGGLVRGEGTGAGTAPPGVRTPEGPQIPGILRPVISSTVMRIQCSDEGVPHDLSGPRRSNSSSRGSVTSRAVPCTRTLQPEL